MQPNKVPLRNQFAYHGITWYVIFCINYIFEVCFDQSRTDTEKYENKSHLVILYSLFRTRPDQGKIHSYTLHSLLQHCILPTPEGLNNEYDFQDKSKFDKNFHNLWDWKGRYYH